MSSPIPRPGDAGGSASRQLSSHIVLDEESSVGEDPLAGAQVGACEIYGRLIRNDPRTFLGFKLTPSEGSSVVLMRALGQYGASPAVRSNAQTATQIQDPHLERVFGIELSDEETFWVSEFVP